MSVTNPAFAIPRRSAEHVAGDIGLFVKMFDPPTESPATPELVTPNNPVPEFMQAQGLRAAPSAPNTVDRQLMHGMTIPTWDNRAGGLTFFAFTEPGNTIAAGGTFPAATIRVPRGVLFHGATQGSGPPPHTIHWHGIEPTPINDGVGHCSMEVGRYTYQWQPNFIGTYFYHCHRNTVQHFEFGLYGMLLIEPPDAFDPANPNRGGYPRRTAANTAAFPQFPGYVAGVLGAADFGINTSNPHAFTIPYDVEALWVFDDRDSVWSDQASSPFAFFPAHGLNPGVDDTFVSGFFNDYNADYWFVTGVPVPAARGGVATIRPDLPPPIGGVGGIDLGPTGLIPPALNSGVTGMQIAINARVNQTILIRALDGAYNFARVTFPVDVVIIAFDGRALGVPPYGNYNSAFTLPAGTPILLSTARRFDALIRSSVPVDSFATVEFLDTQGAPVGQRLMTARIPIVIR